ncbi:hypothetical protein BGW42_002885 [Actinomortierella wolfii]|nr:hypothetical protein BGW42_002885 [Actinomortierella wolfii]
MAVQMDDYAVRVTGSSAPSLQPDEVDVSGGSVPSDNRLYKSGESLASSTSSSKASITTIPMYFSPTKQSIHTSQPMHMDPSQDRQADQPAVVAPGSQSNGKIDLSTSAGEDRSQPAQRLVVRLDLRKIHTPRKGDTKGDKKVVYSKPAPSARTLRQRPEPPVHQVTHAKSNSSASVSTRSSQTAEVSRSNGNSAGTGSDSSAGAGVSNVSSTSLARTPSATSSSISTTESTRTAAQSAKGNDKGVETSPKTKKSEDVHNSTGSSVSSEATTLIPAVRKRTRSSSEGPDKRQAVAISSSTSATATKTISTAGSPRTVDESRSKRRGRPSVSDRSASQGQESSSPSSSAPKTSAPVLRGRPSQKLSVLAKMAQKRDHPGPNISKQDISVTGDDSAIKHPPKPNRPGLFKQLLDNMDRMNPKAFALPQDIRTYFRGVVTNSDGEYSDAIDYKPTPKRHSSNTGTSLSVEEDPLHLRDANGHYKACFRCNRTALGRQMIRCDHCPLYWHLDCLSPPLAHPPPSTRKWMCPNHADHVIPKRRKKRNLIPVTLSTPLARNDGDIEVLSDGSDFDERMILLDDGRQVSSRNVIYRVPEHGIKLGFVQKCRQIRQQQQQEKMKSQIGAGSFGVEEDAMSTDEGGMEDKADDHDTNANFRRLIAVAALEMRDPGASELLSALVSPKMSLSSSSSSSSSSENATHAILVQDAVLQKLDSKEEQDEYLQFRAFQQMVREQGAKNLVRRLVKEHEAQKAEAAMEGLLKMGECSSS